MNTGDLTRIVVWLVQTFNVLLMATYYILLRDFSPKAQTQSQSSMSQQTAKKLQNVMKYAAHEQNTLLRNIIALSIINAIIVETYLDYYIGWTYNIILVTLIAHPSCSKFLPKSFVWPNDLIDAINLLYDTQFFLYGSIYISYIPMMVMVSVLFKVFFFLNKDFLELD